MLLTVTTSTTVVYSLFFLTLFTFTFNLITLFFRFAQAFYLLSHADACLARVTCSVPEHDLHKAQKAQRVYSFLDLGQHLSASHVPRLSTRVLPASATVQFAHDSLSAGRMRVPLMQLRMRVRLTNRDFHTTNGAVKYEEPLLNFGEGSWRGFLLLSIGVRADTSIILWFAVNSYDCYCS